ncbi:MAG TPA: hypothetical protein VJ183_20105 [Chloroflexia bacterium]|nr:hypothetical protein [Chloroflexia bacterium]
MPLPKDCPPEIRALFSQYAPPGGLIYIGVSSDLSERQHDTHFDSTKTGRSTVRRSLGALLNKAMSLQLVPIPRGRGRSEADYYNYRFERQGEESLTRWMVTSLEVGICALPEYKGRIKELESLETVVIQELEPVLCLNKWPNPLALYIKELRAECAQAARLGS